MRYVLSPIKIFSEITEYREREKTEMEKLNFLEMQTSILKASAGKMNTEEKIEFEKRINQYIRSDCSIFFY